MRIADFGSSVKLRAANDSANFVIGSAGYMAPEVASGEEYSLGCDIWGIGALMHLLLSFKLPFVNEENSGILEYKIRACIEPLDLESDECLSQLSEPAKDLLRCMLDKEPQSRPSIEQVLAH